MTMDKKIPNNIYTLWFQGKEKAPPIVKLCFEHWSNLNKDYNFHILDRSDVQRILKDFPTDLDAIPIQALSDILRAKLLLESGGIWVDAAVFPTLELKIWIDEVSTEGFFAFEKPGPDRPLSSWFLAVSPAHEIMNKWWNEIIHYWGKPRQLIKLKNSQIFIPDDPVWQVSSNGGGTSDKFPYFWFHYLFKYLLENDNNFKLIWDRCPKKSALQAHELQHLFLEEEYPSYQKICQKAILSPVQKLNWRNKYPITLLQKL